MTDRPIVRATPRRYTFVLHGWVADRGSLYLGCCNSVQCGGLGRVELLNVVLQDFEVWFVDEVRDVLPVPREEIVAT